MAPASPVQSEFCWQRTELVPDGHDVMHRVPVKPFHSVHVFPHELTLVVVPITQQTGPPASKEVQSTAAVHCQSIVFAGHAVPASTQVDGVVEPDGVSQQCWPAAQLPLPPPSGLSNGQ